jgi:hypothetical protein
MKYIMLFLLSFNVYSVGFAGLDYVVYSAGGATPSRSTNRTILTSGRTDTLNYDWGGGVIMSSGNVDGVIIHFTGSILWPGTAGSGSKSVTFYDRSDDGFYMTINDTIVINNWVEQGPANFNSSGSITLTAGQVYNIDVWWYENGGGAVIQLDWNIGSGITVVPVSNFATSASFFVPVLCCGGSSSSFSANPVNLANLQDFINRSTADSQVYINQIGTANTITVNQSGTLNNYANYTGNGSGNTINIDQSSSINTTTNYTSLNIIGNNNSVDFNQNSTGGNNLISANIIGNSSSLLINQSGSGNHYVETSLSDGDKHVDITQQGSGNHMANIGLSGNPVDLSLTQSGSTQHFYSINFNCTTAGGCPKISVQQQ